MSDEHELMKKKVNYFLEYQKPVHVKFKKKYWKNGLIKEMSHDFFMLDERLEGMIPVFYIEVLDLEEYKEAGE